MQVWTEIRRKVLVEKVSVRQICRDYGLSHHTVAKMLENVEPPGYQQGQGERPRPKLGLFLGVIDQILEVDKTAPKKQRHTAKRVFERLRDEHGYEGSESHVRRYLAEIDHRHREVFVPLSQPPGEAQFDFGEAVVEIAGVRRKAALAVMSLPYSDAFNVTAYPRECTETFQKAHDDSFEFFGGVPTKIAYEYVPRNIFGLMCPVALCGAFGVVPLNCGGGWTDGSDRGHITLVFGKGDFFIPIREKGSCHVRGILHEASDGRSLSRVVDRRRD
jgi:transposase